MTKYEQLLKELEALRNDEFADGGPKMSVFGEEKQKVIDSYYDDIIKNFNTSREQSGKLPVTRESITPSELREAKDMFDKNEKKLKQTINKDIKEKKVEAKKVESKPVETKTVESKPEVKKVESKVEVKKPETTKMSKPKVTEIADKADDTLKGILSEIDEVTPKSIEPKVSSTMKPLSETEELLKKYADIARPSSLVSDKDNYNALLKAKDAIREKEFMDTVGKGAKKVFQGDDYVKPQGFGLEGKPFSKEGVMVADDFGKGKDVVLRSADDIVPTGKVSTRFPDAIEATARAVDDSVIKETTEEAIENILKHGDIGFKAATKPTGKQIASKIGNTVLNKGLAIGGGPVGLALTAAEEILNPSELNEEDSVDMGTNRMSIMPDSKLEKLTNLADTSKLSENFSTQPEEVMSREVKPPVQNILAQQKPERKEEVKPEVKQPSVQETKSQSIVEQKETEQDTPIKKAERNLASVNDALANARRADTISEVMNNLNKAFAHMSAANPHVLVQPVHNGIELKTDRASEVIKQQQAEAKLALEKAYKEEDVRLRNEYVNIAREKMIHADKMMREKWAKQEIELETKNRNQKRYEKMAALKTAKDIMNNDPNYKQGLSRMMAFDAVKDSIKQARTGNQAAIAGMGTQLARAMGEVGVLTDADVQRYLGPVSWLGEVRKWYTQGMQGELPESVLKDIEANVNVIGKALEEKVGKIRQDTYKRVKAVFPEEDDNIVRAVSMMPLESEEDSDQLKSTTQEQQLPQNKPLSDKEVQYAKKYNLSPSEMIKLKEIRLKSQPTKLTTTSQTKEPTEDQVNKYATASKITPDQARLILRNRLNQRR